MNILKPVEIVAVNKPVAHKLDSELKGWDANLVCLKESSLS